MVDFGCRFFTVYAELFTVYKGRPQNQEDVNGEKLTVKRWWIFGADSVSVYAEFFTVYKGHIEKRLDPLPKGLGSKKNQ